MNAFRNSTRCIRVFAAGVAFAAVASTAAAQQPSIKPDELPVAPAAAVQPKYDLATAMSARAEGRAVIANDGMFLLEKRIDAATARFLIKAGFFEVKRPEDIAGKTIFGDKVYLEYDVLPEAIGRTSYQSLEGKDVVLEMKFVEGVYMVAGAYLKR
jgi:hypothetical protein